MPAHLQHAPGTGAGHHRRMHARCLSCAGRCGRFRIRRRGRPAKPKPDEPGRCCRPFRIRKTPYVIGALKYAQQTGAYAIAVTCTENPETEAHANLSLTAVTGPEVITGSTRMKAGTAQKLILNMLSTGSMILMGKVYGNLMVDLQCTNSKLKARARRIVMEASGCDGETADKLLEQSRGEAKPAILMHLAGIDYETAVQKLKDNQGRLKQALK